MTSPSLVPYTTLFFVSLVLCSVRVNFSIVFHLLVVIGGGKVYQVLRELLPKNGFEPDSPTRSAAPPTGAITSGPP